MDFWQVRRIIRGYRNRDKQKHQRIAECVFAATFCMRGSEGNADQSIVCPDGMVYATFGDDRSLRVGDAVVAIGDPLGIRLRGTMTDGIISAISRDLEVDGRVMTLLQTNAALNSGNSGGPLINCYGQVIGINTLKIGVFTDNAGAEGLGFAIPSTTVKEIADQLIAQGYVSGRPAIGITGEPVSSFYQFYYNLPAGLYITNVEYGSDARKKGIEQGDILMSIDGNRITGTACGEDNKVKRIEVSTTYEGETYTCIVRIKPKAEEKPE